jgi:hypothetical protein
VTVLPDENLDDFEFLVSGLEDQFQPQTALEWNLLRQLADAEWRMRRVPSLEAALFAAKLHETVRYYSHFPEHLPEDDAEADLVLIGAAAERDASNGDTLSKLSRYEARLSHRYFKALEHLQKIQSNRQHATGPEKRPPAVAGPSGTDANGTAPKGTPTLGGNGRDGSQVSAHAAVLVEPRLQSPPPVHEPATSPNRLQTSGIPAVWKRKQRCVPNEPNLGCEGTLTCRRKSEPKVGSRVTVPVRRHSYRSGG